MDDEDDIDIDAASALYWYLNDNHRGQGSREYSMLSQLGEIYKPGMMEKGPQGEAAESIYDGLTNGDEDVEDLFAEVMGEDEDEDEEDDGDTDEE